VVPLVAYFRVRIDTGARSATRGGLLELLVEAAAFGTAEACREAVLAAYRPTFPHLVVTVVPEVALGPKASAVSGGGRAARRAAVMDLRGRPRRGVAVG
jgi:hypothetical protein